MCVGFPLRRFDRGEATSDGATTDASHINTPPSGAVALCAAIATRSDRRIRYSRKTISDSNCRLGRVFLTTLPLQKALFSRLGWTIFVSPKVGQALALDTFESISRYSPTAVPRMWIVAAPQSDT